ncbi:MAG: hypothetical protein M3Q33_02360, partial [Acidobacteriota bacterium]|nr:hypothetical protein [Acidobacteriota bacterium]
MKNKNLKNQSYFIASWLILIFACAVSISAQTTAFSYQGKLTDAGNPANGSYQLQFKLFDVSGTQIGATLSDVAVTATNGVFTTQLDFGAAAFPGADRFLEISVRRNAGKSYVVLNPRQKIMSAPYAIRSLNAGSAETATTATNATQLGGVTAANYVQTTSTAFVRNQTGQQPSADFNISGTGMANIFNAGTQFNIAGSRILSNPGINNLFAGVGAGSANPTGYSNSFVGIGAGSWNTTGSKNSFVGALAGQANTTGSD